MAKWNVNTESGILRKKVQNDKHEDLLVFGYACKLFRDDEKALYIDQGKHLIPWMGNDVLKIDRYDCRGALSELLQYEANRQDYDTTRFLGLNDAERRMEILCDEERYYSLKNNDEELEMYKEEELKRLHQKGSEIQYNYDVPPDPEALHEETQDTAEQEDQPFIPPNELNIPVDMELPKTLKENARIEKTAMFINKQGLQMEILIKTKQSDNPQFSFMNKDDPLHKYYKHLLVAIKSGQYRVAAEDENAEEKLNESSEREEHEEHYLHPSLLATSFQSAAPLPMPTVIYKPSADCTYSQLVNRIQGTQTTDTATTPPPLPQLPSEPQPVPVSFEQQQYYQQCYYAAQYYEYYKQMTQQFATPLQDKQSSEAASLPPGYQPDNSSQLNMQDFMQNQAAYLQYFQQQQQQQQQQPSTTNPYAQIVSNLSSQNKEAPSSTEQPLPPTDDQLTVQKPPILYNQSESMHKQTNNSSSLVNDEENVNKAKGRSANKKPLLALIAQYGTDSENEDEETVKIPPDETRQIIDKMASYVLKNGKDFEGIVRSKGDRRFEFLNESHEHHPYYVFKIKESSSAITETNTKITKTQHNGASSKSKEKKIITPVSFSIKKPKEEVPKEIKSALPIEESDDDQEEEKVKTVIETLAIPTNATAVVSGILGSSIIQTSPISRSQLPKDTAILVTSDGNSLEPHLEVGKEETELKTEEVEKKKIATADELILEMIDLTDDLEERRENRRVEDRKKDKIVSAAREKLALQLERKKKAAAFLKLKSVQTSKGERSDRKRVRSRSGNERKNQEKDNSEHSADTSSKRGRSVKVTKEKNDEDVLKVEDSESEEGEIKKHKKNSKKKKSHKSKRSRSRHDSKSNQYRSREHKKSKKHRRRSDSCNSHLSAASP